MNTESNRLEEGFEYSFMDEEVVAKKYNALRLAEEYNSLGIDDIDKTYGLLKEILGSVGEEVYTGCCPSSYRRLCDDRPQCFNIHCRTSFISKKKKGMHCLCRTYINRQ